MYKNSTFIHIIFTNRLGLTNWTGALKPAGGKYLRLYLNTPGSHMFVM